VRTPFSTFSLHAVHVVDLSEVGPTYKHFTKGEVAKNLRWQDALDQLEEEVENFGDGAAKLYKKEVRHSAQCTRRVPAP
jgi:hypothetical protein